MTTNLVAISREYFKDISYDLSNGEISWRDAWLKDNHYTLFRYEDWPAWVIFTAVFCLLIVLDNAFMNRQPRSLTVGTAVAYTFFWMVCALCFCGWVYFYFGPNQAMMWLSGYLLEWMLSFDNLFVFHMIFTVYGTPDHLKHRPLYLGVCGAVVFRLAFIFVGEYLMHAMFLMHLVFGAFLIYTGVRTAMVDEDDDDPSKHPVVQWLQQQVPFISTYDGDGHFFVHVSVDSEGRPKVLKNAELEGIANYGSTSDAKMHLPCKDPSQSPQRRATLLFLVLICLETSDLLFAVDSVSAIVAQVNDLFLAYTSTVFAMLGLRAMFFIIDRLAKLFSLLKYGVAAVLVFIGCKLMLARFLHVPPGIVCLVLVSSIALSMVASVVYDRFAENDEDDEDAKDCSLHPHCEFANAEVVRGGSPVSPSSVRPVQRPTSVGQTV